MGEVNTEHRWACRLLMLCAALAPLAAGCETAAGDGLPAGMIALFDQQCPAGWTRYAALDGRFARGAEVAGGRGGEVEHVHAFDITARTSRDGAHFHMLATGEQVEVDPGFFGHMGIYKGFLQGFEEGGRERKRVNRARAVTDEDGVHDHLISVTGDSMPSDHLPPYVELVYCRKD